MLYIGPAVGMGGLTLIVLILLLILFSFGYRLWFFFSNISSTTATTNRPKKPRKRIFGPSFYLALLVSFLIIFTLDPELFGKEYDGYYGKKILGLPMWVSVFVFLLIAGALAYTVFALYKRRKRRLNSASSQEAEGYKFSPLHAVVLLSIVLWYLQSSIGGWVTSLGSIQVSSLLLGLFAGILLGQGLIWLKPMFFDTAKNSLRLLNQLVAPKNAPDKLELLNSATNKTLGNLFSLTFYLAVIFYDAYVLSYVVFSESSSSSYSIIWVLVALSVGTILPFLRRKKRSSAYSDFSQLFHHIILDNYHVGKTLLKRQIKRTKHPVKEGVVSAVLVTGLARSGTTALTRLLNERGPFRSLNYSNMPVLLAPRLWARFYRPNREEKEERAHGDGIKVGLASVEALEEYFFKVIKDDRFITEDRLLRHDLSVSENELYRKYFKSLCKPGEFYLAKNNNAILRLPSLTKLNPDLRVFILIRDPLEHAYSLHGQHQNFLQQQEKDPFILTYMNWLGHHEFGKGQLPFDLGALGDDRDREKLDFWLERWIEYYSYAKNLEGVQFIRYEEFLARPSQVVERIAKVTGMTINAENIPVFEKTPEAPRGFSPDLALKAQKVYEGLG